MAKKKLRDHSLYVEDILESINKIQVYTKGMSFSEFAGNQMVVDAVVRNFEVIGEAARQFPKSITIKYPDIEWKSIIAFRNVIIHEYFGIDLEIMWDIITHKLCPLDNKIKKLLKKLP